MKDEKLMDDKEWANYLKYGAAGQPTVPLKARTRADVKNRAEQLEKPKQLIGPFQSGTWGILAAPPGVGKSMLAMKIAWHLVTGHDLEHWTVPERRAVLLIDAEMGPREIDARLDSFGNWPDDNYLGVHDLDVCDVSGNSYFSLSDEESQNSLIDAGIGYDVVIIDNIEFTLDAIRPGEIYNPETWKQVFPLLNWAVQNDKLLILIDHTNAAGGVQGTLSKQRGARFILSLEKVESEADMCFTTKFKKLRYLVDKDTRTDITWTVRDGEWKLDRALSMKETVGEMIIDGYDNKEMASELGVTIRAIQRIRKQLEGTVKYKNKR